MTYRVVVTDQVFPDVEVERSILASIGAELLVPAGDRGEVLAAAHEADALLNTYMALDRPALESLPRCRIVARYGIGIDNIDLDAARDARIVVTNVPDYCVEEVAAHTVAMLLSLLRRLPEAHAAVRDGGWGIGHVAPPRRLSTLTIGLVGYGRIARRVAGALAPFGPRLVAHDPYAPPEPPPAQGAAEGPVPVSSVGLDELFATSDAVLLHCPLTSETRGLVDAKRLRTMRSHAVLVNTSRGPLVVMDDLVDALRAAVIAGAALDVFETEPPDAAALADVPRLMLSPHVAFYSVEAIRESQHKAATQVRKVLAGEPPDYRVV